MRFVLKCTSATWPALPATERYRMQTRCSSNHHVQQHKNTWAVFSSDIKIRSECRFSAQIIKNSITLFAFTHSFYTYPFYDAMSFFMWTMRSSGAGGEVAQSIKTYGRCSLYLLSAEMREKHHLYWLLLKMHQIAQQVGSAGSVSSLSPAAQRPLHYDWGVERWQVGGDHTALFQVKLCGRLHVRVIMFQPCVRATFLNCEHTVHLDDSGCHPIAI